MPVSMTPRQMGDPDKIRMASELGTRPTMPQARFDQEVRYGQPKLPGVAASPQIWSAAKLLVAILLTLTSGGINAGGLVTR